MFYLYVYMVIEVFYINVVIKHSINVYTRIV